jgi:hypothetical protein
MEEGSERVVYTQVEPLGKVKPKSVPPKNEWVLEQEWIQTHRGRWGAPNTLIMATISDFPERR